MPVGSVTDGPDIALMAWPAANWSVDDQRWPAIDRHRLGEGDELGRERAVILDQLEIGIGFELDPMTHGGRQARA